jgi:E3 ubiquitin-protein ligase HUWE1
MLDHHMAASGFPQTYATALFSFLYSLASYAGDDVGRKALVACGMMESLLKVINHHCEDQDHITVRTAFERRMFL